MAGAERFVPRFFQSWLRNRYIINTPAAKNIGETNKVAGKFNDIIFVAPLMKWGLSLVPIVLTLTGGITPESVDVKQASSLAFTGVVWTYYSILLGPKNPGMMPLIAVNAAMAAVNGYNAFRGWRHQYPKEKVAKVDVVPNN